MALPGYFVVLDVGTAPTVQAWRATPRHMRLLQPGDVVTVRVQRWTKSLISAESVAALP